jgi:hypothetical protein
VEETTESTAEGRMRHFFQTECGVFWERAAGPLQGALTLKTNTLRNLGLVQGACATAA